MAQILAIGTLVVGGLIVADLVIHPKGTSVISGALTNITRTTGNQLLGYKS